ncbi:DUF3502 domain-containing protein [Paenibacillus mucilaginosus]|nr:DUF3502 domain-containing protein [Paenibacillus mucilaginosus]MCG7214849.1 extracellular solute-binding protein [Paenibacillus mucilaginosus]WDM26331.1 DUF3502 domain-containing protein [Paenibacillus mucilaginosus]
MVTRKIGMTLLSAVMAVSLTACSGGGNSESGKAAPGPAGTADSGQADTSKFETITYVMLGDKPKNGQVEKVLEKINVIMKEKINAKLELKWVEWADWQTKYNLLLASGEPVDLITTATDWLDAWPNAQKGAFLPLDQLLPKYAPETWKEIKPEEWDQTKYKDKIYMIPENSYTQWVNHGFFYRGDWAKEFGITEPIKDFETMGKYFQGIKDKKPDVIPWDSNGTNGEHAKGFIQSKTDAIELAVPTGYLPVVWGKSYDERYTAHSPIFDDTFVDFAKMMKAWADRGYWREDVLNYKGNVRDELKAGQTGADQHHTQTFSGLRTEMDAKQPGSELQMFAWSDTRGNLISQPITHGATAVGAKSKHPERALMAYELIRQNKEVYYLMNYGIEGVQYVIKDGKRAQPEGYDATRDGFSSNFWGGRVDRFEIPSATTWDGIKDIYKKYDGIKKPYPYGRFVLDKSKIDPQLTAMSQVTSQMGPAIAYGKAGDPVKAVEDLRSKLKAAGYDKVMAEVQRQLDEYKKLVESK